MSEINQRDRLKLLNTLVPGMRGNFIQTLKVARNRLHPSQLTEETSVRAMDWGLDVLARTKASARAHPIKALGIAASVGVFLARRPLFRLAVRGVEAARDRLRQRRQRLSETQEESEV